MSDEVDYRKASRTGWGQAAAGWAEQRAAFERNTMPVSAALAEAIAPQPGHTILELAAGIGDTGYLALELAQPGGELITTDFAPEMLTAAQARAEELGVADRVRFKQVDAESIDLDAASVDGVLCRWGYMLMLDPGAALRETRRVLRPGGRVALAAWAAAADNPWMTAQNELIAELGFAGPVTPGEPGPFAWSEAGTAERFLEEAGFADVEAHRLPFSFRFASFDEHWTFKLGTSRFLRETLDRHPGAEEQVREALRERLAPQAAADGSLTLPAETWVAAATA